MIAEPPLVELYYEQSAGTAKLETSEQRFTTLGPMPPDLAFSDSTLDAVHEAWRLVMGSAAEKEDVEYMKFPDRQGFDEDEAYD